MPLNSIKQPVLKWRLSIVCNAQNEHILFKYYVSPEHKLHSKLHIVIHYVHQPQLVIHTHVTDNLQCINIKFVNITEHRSD